MLQRITYGALAISLLFALLAADALVAHRAASLPGVLGDLLSRGSLIPLICVLVSLLASLELCNLLVRSGLSPHRRWATISCVALVLAPWLSSAGLLGSGPVDREGLDLQIALTAFAFLGATIAQLARRNTSTGLVDLAGTWLVIVYTGLLPGFLIMLRCDVDLPGRYGPWILLVFLAVCKSSDIGAYFVGSALGRHKLIPHVSPGKSVEGVIGGIAAACAVSLLFLVAHWATFPDENPTSPGVAHQQLILLHEMTVLYHRMAGAPDQLIGWSGYAQAIVFAVLVSVSGLVGDLTESIFKRSAKSKDSGDIMPGFGGILDMVDSPFAAAPVAWFLLTRLWNVV